MSLTSTSEPPLDPSDICPYLSSSVPYYLVTVVQPYSEDVAPSSFNIVFNLIKWDSQELFSTNILDSRHHVSTYTGLIPVSAALL